MSTDFASKLLQLDKRSETIRAKLLDLTAKRRDLVIAAADGDERAKTKVLTNEAEAVHLQSELRLIDDARGEIENVQREAKAEAERRDLERRQNEDREDRTSMLAAATMVDQAANALRDATEQYVKRAAKVKANGIVSSGYIQRLYSKGCLTSAANAARLGDHYEMGLTNAGQRFTLAEHCRGLFGKDTAPTPEPVAPKRVPPAAPTPTSGPTRYIG
jgi:hypothetical protein